MRIRSEALLPLLFLPAACSRQPTQATAPPDAAVASVEDAGAPDSRVSLSIRERLLDGGLESIEIQPNARTPIEPTQQLEVSTNAPLVNYRIRVFDEADRAMVSDDVAESSDGQLDYRINFHEPLKPGHRYTLVLDAQSGSAFSDQRGNEQAERRLELQVAGERQKVPAKKNVPKKRRRR
jgi:hypothetical protein